MCTAVSFLSNHHYFGRNLDLEYSYKESIVITPRNFSLPFRKKLPLEKHFAIIGMAYVCDNYPLYYDATNEFGLSMAGLNFPEYADYKSAVTKKDNVTPFELIPWILGQCANISEAKALFSKINILKEHFSDNLPLTPLHWLLSDREHSIVIESVYDGLNIYDNPIGVLTNSPTFDMQLFHLNNYMHLTTTTPTNHFSKDLDLKKYSNGMGALGMPGDWSSQSRFVKAAFVKMNSVCGTSEAENISQFFHILGSVEHPRGCVKMSEDLYEITLYSSCCNTDKGIYYYKTYDNSQITAVSMHNVDLNSDQLFSYPLNHTGQVYYQN